jgi:hypothetical protein
VDPTQLSPVVGALYVATALHTPAAALTATLPGQVIVGFCVSDTVTVNEQVLMLPAASVTLNVFVVTPTGKFDPLVKPAI